MDMVDLLTMGNAALMAEDERAKALIDAKEAALDLERGAALEVVREALGLSTEMFEKFKPEYRFENWPNVILYYKDQIIGFTVELNKANKVRFTRGATAIEYLAVRMAEIERDTDQKVRETLQVLSQPISIWWMTTYSSRARHIGWNLPEVRTARVAMLKRVFEAGVLSSRSLRATWLKEVKQLDDLPEVAERFADWTAALERANARDYLLDCIEKRLHPISQENFGSDDAWDEDHGRYSDVVTREEVAAYVTAAADEGLSDDADVLAAIAKREQQMLEDELQADREAQRTMLEATLFRPFQYYEVRYAMLGKNEDTGEREVDWDSFATLHEQPDAGGFYHTTTGKVIKPHNIIAVLRHEIVTVEAWLALSWSWLFMQQTDFGNIRAVPDEAEKLS